MAGMCVSPPPARSTRQPSAPSVTATPPVPRASTSAIAQVEVGAPCQRAKLIAVRPEPVGVRQRAADPLEVALAARMQHVDSDQGAGLPWPR